VDGQTGDLAADVQSAMSMAPIARSVVWRLFCHIAW